MRVWRVVPAGQQAFDGEGTRRFGSRWVPKGLPAIYTSTTLSLAALELFVHTDPDLAPAGLVAISADIPHDLVVHEIALSGLPQIWREIPAPSELQELGRSWIVDGTTGLLSVPSVVVPTERNYVLNPAHPGFRRIEIGEAHEFSFDPRMWKGKTGALRWRRTAGTAARANLVTVGEHDDDEVGPRAVHPRLRLGSREERPARTRGVVDPADQHGRARDGRTGELLDVVMRPRPAGPFFVQSAGDVSKLRRPRRASGPRARRALSRVRAIATTGACRYPGRRSPCESRASRLQSSRGCGRGRKRRAA